MTPADRTDLLYRVASDFVDARNFFRTADGGPDLQGRTHDYRMWVREVMSQAGVPASEMPGLQASIRYHAGNIMRLRVTEEDLAAAGLKRQGPRDRAAATRTQQAQLAALLTGDGAITTGTDLLTVATALHGALGRVDATALDQLTDDQLTAAANLLRDAARLAETIAGAPGRDAIAA